MIPSWRPADAEHEVDAGTRPGRHDGAGDVAVADVVQPRARVADLLREPRVPRPVQHDHGDVRGPLVLGLGHPADVLADRQADVDDVGRVGSGRQLVHVEDGARVVHRAALGHGQDGDGVAHSLGGQRGSVDGVDGDVDLRTRAVADLLAVVEHRGVVLLALADDDDTVHADARDEVTHGLDGGTVGAVLVTSPDPATGGHGGRLGHAYQLEREVAVRTLRRGQWWCRTEGAARGGHRSARPRLSSAIGTRQQ